MKSVFNWLLAASALFFVPVAMAATPASLTQEEMFEGLDYRFNSEYYSRRPFSGTYRRIQRQPRRINIDKKSKMLSGGRDYIYNEDGFTSGYIKPDIERIPVAVSDPASRYWMIKNGRIKPTSTERSRIKYLEYRSQYAGISDFRGDIFDLGGSNDDEFVNRYNKNAYELASGNTISQAKMRRVRGILDATNVYDILD